MSIHPDPRNILNQWRDGV